MTEIAEHFEPIGKAQAVAVWRKRIRMPVPTAEGVIMDVRIVGIYETTTVNGLPLDLLIEARRSSGDPVKRFGVILSESPPDWSRYSIPVLWRRESSPGVGKWRPS
jgi:hypothetical protein